MLPEGNCYVAPEHVRGRRRVPSGGAGIRPKAEVAGPNPALYAPSTSTKS
jgi:hypothetical protein